MAVGEVYRKGLGAGYHAVEVVEEDVVIAAGVHLGEAELELFGAQAVDVHKLGVELVVASGDAVCKGVRGVQRCEHRDAEQDCVMVHRDVVGYGLDVGLAGVDYVIYLAVVHELDYLIVG